jgi:dipeptidyl aminopeptidase/acylaminoacyl peptidase
MAATGAALPIVEGVFQSNLGARYTGYTVSDNGSLAYLPGTTSSSQTQLVWVDRKGKEEPIPAPPGTTYTGPRISPDGKQVALGNQGQIWIYDFARQTLSRLTFGATQTGAESYRT